jgi:RNA polymerase sigma factor (sigma-70 family)
MEAIRTDGTVVDEQFAALYRQHAGRVVRLGYLLGADDPEDVAQEAFCRLYGSATQVTSPRSYLDRIVVNLVRDRAKRRRHGDAAVLLLRAGQSAEVEPSEATALRGTESRAVLEALDRLSPRQREAVILRYWADLPYAEVAAAMNVRVGTAKSAVSRGLNQMHHWLEGTR